MRGILNVTCVAAVAALFFNALVAFQTPAKPVVKIGIILPLTGDLASLGEPIRDTALLKAEELKSLPTKFEYKLYFEDNAGEARTALLAAHRLVELNHVDFLIGFWGDFSLAVLPVTQKAGIPHMGLNIWNEKGVGKSPLNFAITTSSEHEAALSIKACQALGCKKVAIIYVRMFDGLQGDQAYMDAVQKSGMQVVANIPFNPGERDFLPYVAKIREAQPDVVLNLCVPPECLIIEKRLKEQGIHCVITALDGAYEGHEDNEYIQNHWYVTCAQPTSDFAAKYSGRFHRSPEYGTGFIYDGLTLISKAYEETSINGKKPDSRAVAAWLRKVHDYKGAVGSLTCDARGFIDTQPHLMRIINKQSVETTVNAIAKAGK